MAIDLFWFEYCLLFLIVRSGTLPRSMIQKGFTEQAEEDKEREEREKLEAKIAKVR